MRGYLGNSARARVKDGPRQPRDNNNPNNPIINTRSYGEDPALVARMAKAHVRGLQENGMLATTTIRTTRTTTITTANVLRVAAVVVAAAAAGTSRCAKSFRTTRSSM